MSGRKKSAAKILMECMLDETTGASCNVAELNLRSGSKLTVHKSTTRGTRASWRLNRMKIPAIEALSYLEQEVVSRRNTAPEEKS